MNDSTTPRTAPAAQTPSATGTFAHATATTAPEVPGRREFFKYRDLLVADATGGRLRAQVMSATRGMSQPTGWHYHVCEAQFVYGLKGWVDLEFEDGRKVRLQAGESLLIPGGMKHNETATSDEFELLEVTLPGDMGTVPCARPAHLD
ncbi:MAG TPA: cupin domain-containing protein [Quisquiliibacterium sp.]|nr:cupin domain-containing protein [Quisquiliibacterium sp.]HQN14234.1 cupin domain-containing protein [Quisquiliibacterium sp.]HQP66729.1 cupin domain-containing protein [Quisquiliibacterium sp.]